MTAARRRCARSSAFAPAIWAKASLSGALPAVVHVAISVSTSRHRLPAVSLISVPPDASFPAPPAVSLISVPPDASFPARTAVLVLSVPPNESFPAPIAVWRPSVPPDASFPAPPPTGCYGRRLLRAAVVGSVQWPSSRRPLPRDVPVRRVFSSRPQPILVLVDVKSCAGCVPVVDVAKKCGRTAFQASALTSNRVLGELQLSTRQRSVVEDRTPQHTISSFKTLS